MKKAIKDIRKGDFIRLKNSDRANVWVRGAYIRELKKYSIYKFDDTNHEKLVSGKLIVFTDFTF